MQLRPGLSLAVLLALAAPLSAQSGFAVVGGLTSATQSYEFEDGEEATGIGSRMGFAIGVAMERGMSNGLSFAPELLYVLKGSTDDDSDFYTKMSYIELPLLFRYGFATSGNARPYITAGPTVAFLASCTVGDDDDSQSCDDAYGADEAYKAIDYGLMFGLGVKFDRFGISARYEMGLANITEESCCTEKNSALMLLGSVSF
jgi:opacity protein-like surface antigen